VFDDGLAVWSHAHEGVRSQLNAHAVAVGAPLCELRQEVHHLLGVRVEEVRAVLLDEKGGVLAMRLVVAVAADVMLLFRDPYLVTGFSQYTGDCAAREACSNDEDLFLASRGGLLDFSGSHLAVLFL
jgi:hypothetical protein